ncbi:hypothetical protein KCU64_g2569, partial [Aureobasidium melanogenum]
MYFSVVTFGVKLTRNSKSLFKPVQFGLHSQEAAVRNYQDQKTHESLEMNMSSVQTSTRFKYTREVRTKATGTIKDINEGADFARKVLEMLGTVVELLNKIAIFPTKLTTQRQALEAEQQRTAATVLKIQDDVRTALDQPNPTKEELEEVMKLAEEQGNKQLPVMSEENIDMFKFHAQIHNPPEECLVRGLLDTGADDSWISAEALRRAKLTGHVKPLRRQREFKGFGGKGVQATQEVTVEWYTSATSVRKSRFFVLENLADDELDMIVGKNDILKYNLVVLRRAAFVLRSLKKTDEKKMDRKNAKDHEKRNDDLAEQQRQKEMKELEDRLEKLRAENPCAGPSPSSPSTNTTNPHRRPSPPPVPAKSAEAIARYKEMEHVPRPYSAWIRSLPGWTGLVTFGLFWVIGATSLPWVRRRSYEVFQLGHLLMFPIFALLMVHGTVGYLQWPMMGYFLAFPVLLVLIERIVRTCNGFSPLSAYLEVLDKETVCITVMMPVSRNFDYRAGQYVLLQVPVLSRWQWHPFTISSCMGNELQLHIKTDGNWTRKLRKLGTSLEAVKIKIGIDGPYGAPAQRFHDFEQTIIVGAGSGVTPFSGILTDLQAKEEQRIGTKKWRSSPYQEAAESRHASQQLSRRSTEIVSRSRDEKVEGSTLESETSDPELMEHELSQQQPDPNTKDLSSYDLETYKRVDFHWMVRDRNNLLWFSDLLNYISAITASSSRPSNIDFRITTHVTQKRKSLSTHIFRWLLEKHRTPEHPESPITGLINATHFGRPDMKTMMNKHYEDMCVLLVAKKNFYRNDKKRLESLESGIKVGVFFCGAPVVGYQLADACRALTAKGREDKTFIEYHFMMEVFG